MRAFLIEKQVVRPPYVSPDMAALRHRNRHLLDNLQAETLQRGNVHGGIRQEADAPDAEVRQNLAAKAESAHNAPGAIL
jgi:hypothetical protein